MYNYHDVSLSEEQTVEEEKRTMDNKVVLVLVEGQKHTLRKYARRFLSFSVNLHKMYSFFIENIATSEQIKFT